MAAGGDANIARIKAFLLVGVAYFLVAILGPVIILMVKGATWNFPVKGSAWSLTAGIVGALGALFVILAFGAKGSPAAVMSIVFAGAPIINATVLITMNKQWGEIRWEFVMGIILAAVGGCLVTYFKPNPHKKAPPAPAAAVTMDMSKYKIS